ncbi:MAG: SdiA-regulated domain-containing protein [Bacteroidia bacterium]|nr:SdiA-regulated domain-containing protein [Bacteroidia bacterium]
MILKHLILLLACVISTGCRLQGELEHLGTTQLDVPEASGMAFKDSLLCVVSDRTGDIYLIDQKGITIERLKTKTKDVEGIAWYMNNFYLANEANKKIYKYSTSGDRLESYSLKTPKLYDPQNGLEGLCFDPYSNSFFVLNEKLPGQLLQFNDKFELLDQIFLSSYSDYSGVATTKEYIWVISDEGEGIAQYDRAYNLLKLYSINMDSPEGIAISEEENKIYIVSDSSSKLFVFALPKLE